MNTLQILLALGLMARSAGLWNVEFENGRFGIARRSNVVSPVAIGADRCLPGSSGYGAAVNTLPVRVEGLDAEPGRFHDELHAMATAAGLREVVAKGPGFWIAGREDLVAVAVAAQTGRRANGSVLLVCRGMQTGKNQDYKLAISFEPLMIKQ